ncbi:hypothetical protein N431DRAFT_561865 [Stipitochalara longipes BDJ]|nr:hypothetical protein N431DRAFT_561865 [Stipitochalara longipes BDJ]
MDLINALSFLACRLTVAHAEIRSLYFSGAPAFTRELIQDVGQQLRKLEEKCGKVFIRGINGVMVEFAIETDRILPSQPDTEFIIGAPFIYYCSIQELTSINDLSIPRIAYSSLRIYHYMALRNKSTKEILDVIPTESLKDTKDIFKSNQQQWEESEQCKQLTSIVQSINISVDIQQIVAFACGSIRHDSEQQTPQSSFQHALVITLRNILSKKQEDLGRISCYAQDPAYSEVDMLILRENGITVLDDPEGFLKVDDSTLVISCAAQVPVKQITLDLARPAAMIWDRIKEHDLSGLLWADPDSSRIWKMILEFYDVFEILGGTEHFGDVVLYIRRATDAPTT